jgi:type I restriction enzyme, R subunit
MTTTHAAHSIHKEIVVEDHIVSQLVTGLGYVERTPDAYDRPLALDRDLLLDFIKTTQADAWAALEAQYSASAESEFFKRLEQALAARGTLEVLREGIKLVPKIRFSLCYFRPASGLNEDLMRAYRANILSVMRQVRYSTRNENAIDIVLFVNGLPVATLEVKNTLTGQNVRHAERQYRKDRSPAGEPLLTFKRGALVHFALDQTLVSMTTRLMNGKTRFLPFNRGAGGGAGNPDIDGDFPIAYLYADQPGGKAIFSREVFLDLIGRFIHLEKDNGREVMIFPRFQQMDAVRKVLADARANGAGRNYLIQHSAGSGKSNTIAWVAHQIINLHDDADKPVFDTAIIVTDRVVLDRQLQNTVAAFEKTKGVVKKIDGTSRDLKDAIKAGARIIITTIQKFGTDHLKELSGQGDRRFAIIVDEAHSSQSGQSAQAMSDALTREGAVSDAVEDKILEYQRARGPQANISYLAFTATPRNVTLERFGVTGPDGLPRPFHLYSMRQAIEEEFILDVLQNYMTYQAYYELEKAVEDDPGFESRRAQRQVAKFASLHPTAIDQKVEIIVEHFRTHVLKELHGQAKAMVVTQSREHALRYWQGLGRYIEKQGYTDLKALVAFSGDLEVDGETWTEAEANGFPDTELPKRFDGDEFQILVVAEKYQTGFDQPKLCAMYVDRKLDGLQAVQTLSRLNRKRADKDKTFILDFRNSSEDIQTAFAPFFETTELEDRSDPNQIYDLANRIEAAPYIDPQEVEAFATIFFAGNLTSQDRIKLEGLVRQAVKRFELDEDDASQEEFRQLLKSFMRFYSFVAQIIHLEDTGLEKLYTYVSWLSRLLPARERPADIDITDDMLDLKAFRVDQTSEGSASLTSDDTTKLQPITEFGANGYTEEEERSLSEIIDSFNERHGTQFTPEDFLRFEQVNRDILDGDMMQMIQNNPADVVYTAFSQAFLQGMIRIFQKDTEMKSIVLSDGEAREQATRHFFRRAQRAAQDARS